MKISEFKINFSLFLIYFSAYLLSGFFESRIIEIIKISTGFYLVFVLSGFCLWKITKQALKIKSEKQEEMSLISIISIIVIPLLLTIEYTIAKKICPVFPVINSLLILCVYILFNLKNKTSSLNLPRKKHLNKFLDSPFVWTLFLNLTIIIIITKSYIPLPDLDPYTWMRLQSDRFIDDSILAISSPRPLFDSMSYIFNKTLGVNLHFYFKYGVPLISILSLFPAWLVATEFKDKLKQFLVMLIPFASASSILYSQTAMPQAFLVIISHYFFFFIVYSWLSKKQTYFYFAGSITALSCLYHETGMLLLLPWLITTLWFKKIEIIKWIKDNRLSFSLILIILLLKIDFILTYLNLSYYWASLLIKRVFTDYNLLFPTHYINVDGNSMGWPGLVGILKYYSYYVGPVFFILTLLLIIKTDNFKEQLKQIYKKKELLVLFSCFIIFFSISEVFPRIFNFAFLPERAWIWGNLFFSILLVIFVKNYKRTFWLIILIAAFWTNISGSIYINSLKKYTISPEHLRSAKWIEANLPNNRILIASSSQKNLLVNYSKSDILTVNQEFYSDLSFYQEMATKIENDDKIAEIEECQNKIDELAEIEEFEKIISSIKNQLQELRNYSISKDYAKKLQGAPTFIYYSSNHKLNPYSKRPYNIKDGLEEFFVFDNYPQKFERIYQIQNENITIIIWKIL